jgi:hypothetical protein
MPGVRNRSVEIYLKSGIDDDDRIFSVYSALRTKGRPQDLFRRALCLGLALLREKGDMSEPARIAYDNWRPLGKSDGEMAAEPGKRATSGPVAIPSAPKAGDDLEAVHPAPVARISQPIAPGYPSTVTATPGPRKLGKLM